MADPISEFQKPAGAAIPSSDEPVIHVIPEKFYGAATKKNMSAPVVPAAVIPPPTPVPSGIAVPIIPKPPQKKKGNGLIIAVVAFIVLAGGVGAAVYFLVLSKPANTNRPPTNTNVSVNQTPVNTNVANQNVNIAPVASCGNALCEAGETTATCASDCPAAAPICGDTRCDILTETALNCAVDCSAPVAACGNNICEATETAATCQADCEAAATTAGVDSDTDGLTDEEERNVFGTNPSNPNSDGDSFVDLNEALNLFDPGKPSPAKLADNPGFSTYLNTPQGYSILRAASWVPREGDATADEVFFTAASGEFIEVLVQPKTQGQSLMDWYLEQAPTVNSSQVDSFTTRQGYPAISSPDRLTTYVDVGENKVIIVTYNIGLRSEVQYKVLFQVMVHSLVRTSP